MLKMRLSILTVWVVRYDLIILDPPAFAKHRDALRNALRGYTKLNAKALEKFVREVFYLLSHVRRW